MNSLAFKTKLFEPKRFIARHTIIALLAVLFASVGALKDQLVLMSQEWWQGFGSNFFYIALIWNGNVLLVEILDHYIKWQHRVTLKLVLNIAIALVWPVCTHYFSGLFIYPIFHGKACALNSAEDLTYLITSVSITLLINAIFIATDFFRFWRQTLTEKEELKRESLSAEFEALKNQINPHFLFNSLNTLTGLIEEGSEQASDFVQKLSSVYRYVLTQKEKEKVLLKDELTFVESYMFLNGIRFGSNLKLTIKINDDLLYRQIATLSLQMLLENAIKHNIISSQKPLEIVIGSTNNKIYVRNNLQRKQVMKDSNGIGLTNIIHRYSFLTKDEVDIIDNGKEFIVYLPLL